MIVPSSAFNLFLTTINTMIGEAYSVTPTEYSRYAQTIPMSTLDMAFGWTGMIPKPRIWNGPSVTNEQAPQMYTVRALPYELTMKLDRFRFNDDTHGIYYRLLPDMARQFKRTPDIWFRDLLTNSGTQVRIITEAGDSLIANTVAALPLPVSPGVGYDDLDELRDMIMPGPPGIPGAAGAAGAAGPASTVPPSASSTLHETGGTSKYWLLA